MRNTTRLRQILNDPGIIVAPGAYDCLTAKIIEREGFPAVYMTGAGTSVSRLGMPDLGLASVSEMVANAADIAASVNVPLIADADTGYGGTLNVRRTIRQYERAGVAAVHVEDQESPKRCGHLDDKRVVSTEDMVRRLRAAVDARTDDDFVIIARTDALAVTDWDDTMSRCEAYLEAGADVLFVEALRTPEQAAQVVRSFDVPMLYNFIETGKSPRLSASELEEMGYKIVIFPVSAFTMVGEMVTRLMRELRKRGTTESMLDTMMDLEECFDMVGLHEMLSIDAAYAEGAPAHAGQASG